MVDKDQDKGSQFLTQSFLKNQSLANKGNDVAALNKTMGSFVSSNFKTMKDLTKSLNSLNNNIDKLAKPAQQKKDLVRREDPQKKLYSAVDDLEGLMRENNKMQKTNKKGKGILDFIGDIAGIAAVGGIVGWLFFGKDKYATQVRDMFGKVGGMLWDGFKEASSFVWTNIKDWWGTGGKDLTFKMLESVKDGLINGALFAWEQIKAHPKLAAVGGLLGLLLTGNIGVLGSLAASFGTLSLKTLSFALANPAFALAVASVATTAFAVMKLKESGDAAGIVKKEREERAKTERARIEYRADAQNLSERDQLRLKSVLDQKELLDKSLEKTPGTLGSNVANVADFFVGDLGKNLFGMQNFNDRLYNPSTKEAEKSGLFERYDIQSQFAPNKKWTTKSKLEAMKYERNRLSQAQGEIFKPYEQYQPNQINMEGTTISSLGEMPNNIILGPNATFKGMENTDTLKHFFDMAKEYGDPIQVNSAFRTTEDQQRLYDLYPDKAVNPKTGTSQHQLGNAIDIQTTGENGFGGWNLLNKYGFKRPISSSEPWHIQYKTGGNVTSDSPEQGDLITNKNLPQNQIAKRLMEQSNNGIELSENTIKGLAQAIGISFKNSWPATKANQISIDTNIRG